MTNGRGSEARKRDVAVPPQNKNKMKTNQMKKLILITTLAILPTFATVARGQAPTLSPTLAPTRTYSGGINDNCQRIGHGAVIKNSPGTIITIHASGYISSGGPSWLLIFNKTTAPVNGDVPAIALPLSQFLGQGNLDYVVVDRDYPGGLPMTTGISWSTSWLPTVLNTGSPGVCGTVTLTVTYQ